MDLIKTFLIALFPMLESVEPIEVLWFIGAVGVLMITRRQFHPRYEFLYRWMIGFSISVVIITIIACMAACIVPTTVARRGKPYSAIRR